MLRFPRSTCPEVHVVGKDEGRDRVEWYDIKNQPLFESENYTAQ